MLLSAAVKRVGVSRMRYFYMGKLEQEIAGKSLIITFGSFVDTLLQYTIHTCKAEVTDESCTLQCIWDDQLYFTAQQCTVLHCTALQGSALHCS